MVAYDPAKSRRFDMGRVIERTFGVFAANLPSFAAMSLLLVALPAAAAGWLQMRIQSEALSGVASEFNFNSFGLLLAAGLVTWVTSLLLQAAVIHASVADLKGRQASIGESLGATAQKLLSLVGLSLLMAIGMALGLLLLIVPGILLMLAWMVAVPAMVVERRDIFQSFERSAQLTRNNRGWLFVLGLVFVVVNWFVTMVVTALGMAVLVAVKGTDPQAILWVNVLVTPLTSALSAVIGAAGVAAVYFELRSLKEGVGHAELASVFD